MGLTKEECLHSKPIDSCFSCADRREVNFLRRELAWMHEQVDKVQARLNRIHGEKEQATLLLKAWLEEKKLDEAYITHYEIDGKCECLYCRSERLVK